MGDNNAIDGVQRLVSLFKYSGSSPSQHSSSSARPKRPRSRAAIPRGFSPAAVAARSRSRSPRLFFSSTKLCTPVALLAIVACLLLFQVLITQMFHRSHAAKDTAAAVSPNGQVPLREDDGADQQKRREPFERVQKKPQPTAAQTTNAAPIIETDADTTTFQYQDGVLPAWAQAVCDEIVFGIKTHARANCTGRLVNTVRALFPCARIFVADDGDYSEKPHNGIPGVEHYYDLPYDTGLAACRNFLVDRVDAPFFMLMDDDFVFTRQTNISFLLEVIKAHPEIDVLGATLSTGSYHGKMRFSRDGQSLNLTRSARGMLKGVGSGNCWYYDIVANFFLARTHRLRELRWDDELRIGEHEEFFVRAYKAHYGVALCTNVMANHVQQRWVYSSKYTQLRLRADAMARYALLVKHNITTIAGFRGDVRVTEKPNYCPCP